MSLRNNTSKHDLLYKIGGNTQIPDKRFFFKTDRSIRFPYAVNNKLYNLVFMRGEDAARLLMRLGKIDYYTLQPDGAVAMYTHSVHTINGPKGQPVQHTLPVSYRWEDIDFSHYEAHTVCSIAELDRVLRQMTRPGSDAMVIDMSRNILRAA